MKEKMRALENYIDKHKGLILNRLAKVIDESEEEELTNYKKLTAYAIKEKRFYLSFVYATIVALTLGCSIDYIIGRSDTYSLF